MEKPSVYQIKVQGQLDESWADFFGDMAVTVEKGNRHATITTLTGPVPDQAALHGVLQRIRDLGLPLLLVQGIEDEDSIRK